jgi:membrane associated rhomboid family serine protease
VGTTDFVAGVSLLMMVAFAISPDFVAYLALSPVRVLHGFVWEVVTWPIANAPDFLILLNIVFFWFTGRQLERQLGKGRYGWMLLGITVAGSLLAVLLALAFRVDAPFLAGMGTITLIVVLLFIADNPRMPVFFGIPAWVLGLVWLIIPLLQLVGARSWIAFLQLVLNLLAAAVIAKFAGLLEQYAFVPGRMYTPRPRKRVRGVPRDDRRRKSAPRASAGASNVVQGPWLGPEPPAREDEEMDALLDKIMAHGLESLTGRERRRLEELRQQRRAR